MKWWLVFPVFLLVLLQTTIIDFNFLLIFVLLLNFTGLEMEGLVFAFAGGILLDLFTGNRLGLSSLALLAAAFLIIFYKKRFHAGNLFFWLLFFFLGSLSFRLLKGQGWRLKEGLIMAFLSLPLFWFVSRLGLFEEREQEGGKLRISDF